MLKSLTQLFSRHLRRFSPRCARWVYLGHCNCSSLAGAACGLGCLAFASSTVVAAQLGHSSAYFVTVGCAMPQSMLLACAHRGLSCAPPSLLCLLSDSFDLQTRSVLPCWGPVQTLPILVPRLLYVMPLTARQPRSGSRRDIVDSCDSGPSLVSGSQAKHYAFVRASRPLSTPSPVEGVGPLVSLPAPRLV